MWILKKPDLIDALKDIPDIIENSENKLTKADEINLKKLYKNYDKQKGSLTNNDLNLFTNDTQQTIQDIYPKTRNGGKLDKIRHELTKNIYKCPLCGIGEPAQLDHLFPQSKYGALAVCRLNLVPECGVCNQYKSSSEPDNFLHPYYNPQLKNIDFFNIKIKSHKGIITWIFKINQNVLSKSENDKIDFQLKRFHLIDRFYKETNGLLINLFLITENYKTIEVFYETVKNKYTEQLTIRGVNDWQTAFYKALLIAVENKVITMNEIETYKKRNFEIFY